METLRLFIALPARPDPPLRALLAAWERHRPWLKPVAVGQLHVTLRFLGPCPADRVPALGRALEEAVRTADATALALPIAGLAGLPPGGRRPLRTLYADLADAAPVEALAAALDDALAALDPPVARRDRPFRAHLTLARAKGSATRRPSRDRPDPTPALRRLLAGHAQVDLGRFRADAVHLIVSRLTPAGPVHRTLHAIPLPEA